MFRRRVCAFVSLVLAFLGFSAVSTTAGVITIGAGTGAYRSTPWSTALSLPRFNETNLVRLAGVNWRATSSVEAIANLRNSSSFSAFPSINGNSTITFSLPSGGTLVSLPTYAGGSTQLLPRSSGNVFGFGNGSANGSLAQSQFGLLRGSGNISFPVSSSTGSLFVSSGGATVNSSQLLALAGLEIDYVTEDIGLSQLDPILPNSSAGGAFEFLNAPGGRWYDPPVARGFTYEIIGSAAKFTDVELPTGFAVPFRVEIGDRLVGTFDPGEIVRFDGGVGVFSITLIGELNLSNPRALPTKLSFSEPTASFRMTPLTKFVPEPSSLILAALGGVVAVFSRRFWA